MPFRKAMGLDGNYRMPDEVCVSIEFVGVNGRAGCLRIYVLGDAVEVWAGVPAILIGETCRETFEGLLGRRYLFRVLAGVRFYYSDQDYEINVGSGLTIDASVVRNWTVSPREEAELRRIFGRDARAGSVSGR